MNNHVQALGTRRWPEVDGQRPIVAVPIGSCEQHGPHLPLDTDTRIAVELCHRLASATTDVLVAPAIGVAASGEHAGFAGTLSIGTATLAHVVIELVRSADWADGVVLVNGHGGNQDAMRTAIAVLGDEPRRVMGWWPTLPPDADAHAGRTETSIMLAIAPETVGDERPTGRTEPISLLLADLRQAGVAAVSPNGVLGDAKGASRAEGATLLDEMAADLARSFMAWRDST